MTTASLSNLPATATISFTWKQLEQLLRGLAETRDHASMVPHLVSGLAKQYLFLEETLLLSEIMKMAVCVSDPQFKISGCESLALEPGLSSSP